MKKVKSVASRRAFSRKPPEKEVVWPERFEAKAVPRQRRRWGPIILAVSGLIIIVCLSLLGLAYGYASAFAREAGVPLMTLVQSVYQGWQEDVWGIDNQVTFLVLGLDAVVNQRDNSQLTDTIMLVIAQRDGTIRLISLPRDLWLAALKTKINALYYYGEKDKLGQGKDFTRTWVTQITGIPIDEIVILKMDWVKTAIDAVGGISVPIETGFSDSQYPRDEADLTSTDPAVLYKAVVFNPGIENMNGARALEYMRSRQSPLSSEGTDTAREKRQQAVMKTLMTKLTSGTLMRPAVFGELYRLKNQAFKEVPDWYWVSLFRAWIKRPITLKTTVIPIKTNEQPDDLLTVPSIEKYGQWVFEPVDPSFKELQQYLQQELK